MGKPYFLPRKFGGKMFKYETTTETRKEAVERRTKLQQSGYQARVNIHSDFGGRGYDVYKRLNTRKK